MENEILIKVESVSKKFCKDLKLSLWYGVKDLISNVKGDRAERNLRREEFWAVKNISFELKRGECLGLIGHNGAGKSTLLKMLNGLIKPDEGKITIRGRVGALIELGAGFNPILSGRENVYNNGAILGLTKQEINDKIEAIIDFSEIREFIDMPVQNYSSGMKVRLGFAIASQMEPDVLIIDEVLAVGDLGFVLKCFKTIDNILPNTAIVFVSHNMPMISRICTHIMLMDNGGSFYQDLNVSKGIDLYYDSFIEKTNSNVVYTSNNIEFINAEIVDAETRDNNIYIINWASTIELKIVLKNKDLRDRPYMSLVVYDKEQRGIAEIHPSNQDIKEVIVDNELAYNIKIKNLYLSKGLYSLTMIISENKGFNVFYKAHKIITIKVEDKFQTWTPFLLDAKTI